MKDEFQLDQVAIRMVQAPPLVSDKPILSPTDAVRLLADELRDYDREVVCMVNMKSNGQPINFNIVSIGALNYCLADPREMLKSAVLSNAASMLLLHNHPSGNLHPSREDVAMTDRMAKVCDLVGIPLEDHIIVNGSSEYFSFRQKEILNLEKNRYTTDLDDICLGKAVAENEKPEKSVMKKLKEKKAVVEKNEAHVPKSKVKSKDVSLD